VAELMADAEYTDLKARGGHQISGPRTEDEQVTGAPASTRGHGSRLGRRVSPGPGMGPSHANQLWAADESDPARHLEPSLARPGPCVQCQVADERAAFLFGRPTRRGS
jgi:hypothetical protein